MCAEALLAVVAPSLVGLVVWPCALVVGRIPVRALDGLQAPLCERLAWWRLVLPLLLGALVLAFLVGWALREPTPTDEHVGLAIPITAVLSASAVVRAFVRGARARSTCRETSLAIGTIGFVRPSVVVSEAYRRATSADVLSAALAHEAAHVHGRDPLRIWLAQLAADLQWPVPRTAHRFSEWLLALEAARDDEAVASGVAQEDLAEAILVAARLQRGPFPGACAQVQGDGGVAWRVRRLLSFDVPRHVTRARSARAAWASAVVLLGSAVWLGMEVGDAVLRAVPGIEP